MNRWKIVSWQKPRWRIWKKVLFTGIFYFLYDFSVAQTVQKTNLENYRMVNWNFEQGFPHKKTTAILKDVNGFLWIGTETGLSRFDGNVFKNYFR